MLVRVASSVSVMKDVVVDAAVVMQDGCGRGGGRQESLLHFEHQYVISA